MTDYCSPEYTCRFCGATGLKIEAHEAVCIYKDQTKCRQRILDMLEEVFTDVMQVFDFGAKKHPDSGDTPNFLTPNGNKCSRRVRGDSCLHHAADTRAGLTADHESGLHPALHGISSLAIMYIRQKRGIVHPEDDVYLEDE